MPSQRWLPRAVWPVVAVHALLLVVTSVVYPTYRAPDETAHVDLVLTTRADGYPPLEGPQLSERVVRTRRVVGLPREPTANPPISADAAPSRASRPTFARAGPDEPSGIPQQLSMHPPLYYRVAAGALSVATTVSPAASWWSFDQVVGFLRLVSAVFVLPLPLLAALTARVLTERRAIVLTAALVPLAIPMLTHIGASVNNDSLLVLLVGLVTVPGVAVARGATRPGGALVLGVLGGLALLTKGFALVVPLWIAAAYGLAAVRAAGWWPATSGRGEPSPSGIRAQARGWWRGGLEFGDPGLRAAGSGALALAVAGGVGGWWWLRNLLRYQTLQPSGVDANPAPPGFSPEPLGWAAFFARRFSERFWIEPEVVADAIPGVHVLASLAVVGLVAVALAAANRVGIARLDLALLALLPLGLAGIVVFGAWRAYVRTGLNLAIHGRYVYGGVVALAPLVAVGLAVLVARARRLWPAAGLSPEDDPAAAGVAPPCAWLPLAVAVVAAVAQLAAGLLALGRYWGPSEALTPGADIAAMLAWSPWSPAVVVLAVLALVAAAVWLARGLTGRGRGLRHGLRAMGLARSARARDSVREGPSRGGWPAKAHRPHC